MKLLIALILLLPVMAMADSSSCHSPDGKVSLDVVAGGGEVTYFESYDPIFFENLNETLPTGTFKNNQDVNELLNFYFQESAWVNLEGTGNAGEARFTVYGQDDSSPSVTVYSTLLECQGDAF